MVIYTCYQTTDIGIQLMHAKWQNGALKRTLTHAEWSHWGERSSLKRKAVVGSEMSPLAHDTVLQVREYYTKETKKVNKRHAIRILKQDLWMWNIKIDKNFNR